jgi:hypothetical protein
MARKSKNLTPSGIFSQFIEVSLVGDRGLGISRKPLCMILAAVSTDQRNTSYLAR